MFPAEHPELLLDFHRILKRGGLALLCMGAGDSERNLRMMRESRFTVLMSEIVKDPTDPASCISSHLDKQNSTLLLRGNFGVRIPAVSHEEVVGQASL